MNYCSTCGAKSWQTPVLTTKAGETWGTLKRMTTTDYLQVCFVLTLWRIIWKFTDLLQLHYAYCEDNDLFPEPNYGTKKGLVECTSYDSVVPDFKRPLFHDRICDGRVCVVK